MGKHSPVPTSDCQHCQPQRVSRRAMLRQSALGFGNLAMASLLANPSNAADNTVGRQMNPLAATAPHFTPRAKRVIFLFMKGGPSHVDTFDYKPRLQRDDGKELPFKKPRVTFADTGKLLGSPWKFKPAGEMGIPVSELFPNELGPRWSITQTPYRQRQLCTSQHGSLGHLWPGNGKPESARIRDDLPHAGPWRCQELGQCISTRPLPGHPARRGQPTLDQRQGQVCQQYLDFPAGPASTAGYAQGNQPGPP